MSDTISELLEVDLNRKIKKSPEVVEGLDCVYQLEIGDRIWSLDLLASDPEVKKEVHQNPDCIIQMSEESFEKLVEGKLNIPLSFITGKIKIKGDKTLALKLTGLFKS